MTIQQLSYVLAIEECGSFTKAAKNLFLSQPNLSSSLKALEQELGFCIFNRTQRGVSATPKGMELLKYARSIITDLDNISGLKSEKSKGSFRLETIGYTAFSEAFIRLCLEYENREQLAFSVKTGNFLQVVEGVYNNRCNIGTVIVDSGSMGETAAILKKRQLVFHSIQRSPLNVNICGNHPLLQNGTLDFTQLKKYPCVEYRGAEDLHYNATLSEKHLLDENKVVIVEERETRCRLVSESLAYSVGCAQHPLSREMYHTVSVPIPGQLCEIGYIVPSGQILSSEVTRYIQLLKDELSFLD